VLARCIVRAAIGTGRELAESERTARARPWGVEAFVRGYAASRGLTLEDAAVVRRRFDSPVRGHAVAALHGHDGHLLLWVAPDGERWVLRVGPDVDSLPLGDGDWSAAALDRVRAATVAPAATG
jgi:hypothetical protein